VRRIVAITLGLAYLIAEFFNVPEVGLRWAVWLSCDLSGAFTFLYLYVHRGPAWIALTAVGLVTIAFPASI